MHLCELATGKMEVTFPLDIGSVVGYSGKRKDTQVKLCFYCVTVYICSNVYQENLILNVFCIYIPDFLQFYVICYTWNNILL